MRNWQLEIGTYPGIMLGMRSYDFESGHRDHVFYVPFVCFILSFFEEEELEDYD